MMLLDLSNVTYGSVVHFLTTNKAIAVETDLVRHICFNVIRNLNNKWRFEYGPMVICADSRTYWRKQVFPHYKAHRKEARDKSKLDWPAIFTGINQIKKDLAEIFPYKFIEVEGAEADDIIGVAARSARDKTLIISSDRDFMQLQSNRFVAQYDPVVTKKLVNCEDPAGHLFDKIVRGDRGDGIPSIVCPDNYFVVKQKKKKLTASILESVQQIDSMPEHPLYRNYRRNKALIDLRETPVQIVKTITEQLAQPNYKDRSRLLQFFAQNQMKVLATNLSDF